jgi:hypothetical protein
MVANDRDLMQLHVDALFTRDMSGDLVRVNEPAGLQAPRFFVGLTRHGVVHRFRHDVDFAMRSELEAALRDAGLETGRADEPLNGSHYASILERTMPVVNTWSGPAFTFPDEIAAITGAVRITENNAELLKQHFQGWIVDIPRCQPMFGVAVDGEVVTLCCSVRRTEAADEAGVETTAAYRGRNYARLVVTAWARAVRECDRTPLYSTSWSNLASRAVARGLGLVVVGSDLHIT